MKSFPLTRGWAMCMLTTIYIINSFNAFSQNIGSPALSDKNSSEISADVKNLLNYYDKQVYFTQNNGQWSSNVVFKADFPLGQAIATKQGMMVGTFDPAGISARFERGVREEEAKKNHTPFNEPKVNVKGHGWMMNFLNSSPLMTVESKTKHKDVFNYFGGNANVSGASNFQEVWYHNVYDNVDVRYYPSQEGTLEYDMVCKPGFNKDIISIQMDGISKVTLKHNGSLELKTSVGNMTLPAPVAYQMINGQKVSVDAHYVVTGNNVVTFKIGDYDAFKTLIVDPIALRWATWINTNSTGENHGHGIWVDPTDGAIYVVARVDGSTDQITVGAFDESANGGIDLIIGKYLEPDNIGESGTRVWQTYVGGSSDDNPYAIEQGPDGNLYITGYTGSSNFPLLGGSAFSGSSIDNRSQTADNCFIMKISQDGNSIKSAVVGGNGDDGAFDLRFAPDGGILVCGNTQSTNLNTLYGMGSNTNNGGVDVIVFKINADLSALSWLQNYGGSGTDQATIMLNNPDNGDIYLAGYTSSSGFQTISPRQGSKVGSTDGFIQKLKSSDGTRVWSSYFNSSGSSITTQILCMEFSTDRSRLYFGGLTGGLAASNLNGRDITYNGGTRDFFVTSMDTNQNFVHGTYVGGGSDEVNMMGLNVDLNNDVYVFGYSASNNFPMRGNPLQSLLNTNGNSSTSTRDKVFFKLQSPLDSLLFSTFYGGTADDYDPVGERGIKFSNCRIYTIVTARSNNIPLTEGALNTQKLSSTSTIYEPGLVVWANPPDLANNTITGSQNVCKGETPDDFTGSEPSYILPNISRNLVITPYPVSLPSATTYQWQSSTDSINWTNVPGGTTQNLSNSLIGAIDVTTYFRRIIGGDACVIAGAADQSVKVNVLHVNGDVTNITCYGAGNGSITANPDGTPEYTYSWSNGESTQTISNLTPGSYTVTVTDAHGCSASNSFEVTQPDAPLSADASATDATCGNSNGTASVEASGGTPDYSYQWSSGGTAADETGLAAGTYTVTVTDANGCSFTTEATVHQATDLSASESHDPILCHGGSTTVTISATGGTEPYSGTGEFEQSAGSVLYEVTDYNGCTSTVEVNLTEPDELSASESHTAILCNGGSSTVSISATGGTGSYTGTGDFPQSANDGTVTYYVSDENGCTTSVDVTVSEPDVLSVDCSSTGGNCIKGFLGSACVDVTGGTESYSYSWDNGGSDACIEGLQDGNYSVTVTDHNGCSASCSTEVHNSTPIEIDETHVNVSVQGGSDGSIDITATGGGGSYTYLWNDGNTNEDRSGLSAGHYCVVATDASGCTGTLCVDITEPQCHCTPPTNITFTSLVNDQVQICWDPQACATGYILQYQWKGHSNWYTVNITAPDHCIIIDLKGHVVIYVKIATICSDGSTTNYSSTISYKWTAPCTPPSNMSTTNITATSATVNWTPGTVTSSQKVRYQVVGQQNSIVKTASKTATTLNITGLLPSTKYTWKVKGDCWSGNLKFTTAAQRLDEQSVTAGEIGELSVYPNPASDILNVDIKMNDAQDHPVLVQLINVVGQIMISDKGAVMGGHSSITLDLNNGLSSGVYTLRLISGDQVMERKVVISKQ